MNSLWLVVGAVCRYLIGYRFYPRLLAERAMMLDDRFFKLGMVKSRHQPVPR